MPAASSSVPGAPWPPQRAAHELGACAARQTSGAARHAFGRNASQLDAAVRTSSRSAGGRAPSAAQGYQDAEADQFSTAASFSYQSSPMVRHAADSACRAAPDTFSGQ